jgi:hypothetical protein
MKTKFCLFIGLTVAILSMGLGVARAQMGGGASSLQSGTTNDTKGLKPGSSLGGGKFVPIIISPEEAAKKYPMPNGKPYPDGMDEAVLKGSGNATHSGYIKSPYSSRVYDCRKLGTGTLLLDDSAKKVFVRPQTR